jgi:hypothetical protein
VPPLTVRFTGALWRWQGDAPWHFLTVPPEVSDDVREAAGAPVAFGSVRVTVTVGGTTWSTSLFPHKESGGYLLPVKKDVRVREDLQVGEPVDVLLELA